MELIDTLVIKEWNPNSSGGAWFPLKPVVGKRITIEKYNSHYRWSNYGVDTVVPKSCFVEIKKNCLTIWDKDLV